MQANAPLALADLRQILDTIRTDARRTCTQLARERRQMRQEVGDWAPIPDTQLKAKFDAWIKEIKQRAIIEVRM